MVAMVVGPAESAVNNFPAANAQATVASEAPNAAAFIVVTAIFVSLAAVATPPAAPTQWVLRDGATGAGTIKLSGTLNCVANSGDHIELSGLNIQMSAGNVATLEFVAAGGATTQQGVAMTYYPSTRLS